MVVQWCCIVHAIFRVACQCCHPPQPHYPTTISPSSLLTIQSFCTHFAPILHPFCTVLHRFAPFCTRFAPFCPFCPFCKAPVVSG